MPLPGSDRDKTQEQLISELEKMREQVARLKSVASAGIVHNLAYFKERLAEEVSRSSRYKYNFSIVIVEADTFEAYSKKCGSAAGDELMGMLQTILRNALRLSDFYCHFESSRFGILLPYTDSDGAGIVAGRIVQTLERVMALKSMSTHIPLTMSAGIAVFPGDAVSEIILLDVAGGALKRARAKGGNCYCFAGADQDSEEPAGNFMPAHTANEVLLEFLDDEIQRSSRYSTELSLMLLSFSELDQDGGLTTQLDKRRVAPIVDKYISSLIRGTDRPFPYNENQLAVLLPNTNAGGAQILAKKIFQAFAVPAGTGADEKAAKLSVNIGIASFPIDEVSRNGLVRGAEAALNMAMRKGSNQVVLASSLTRPDGGSQRDVAAWIDSLRGMGQNSIYNLLAVVDATERYVVPHSQNTTKLSMAIGQVLGLHTANIRKLRVIALLHDVGKIFLAPAIINKAGPLDDKELAIMRKHPEFGANILQQFTDFSYAAKAVLAHHERMDGKGYPSGLAGEQIPLESRIIAVAEAFDDMVTPRPYREQLSIKAALQELDKNAGKQFDFAVANALKKALSNVTSE
jgi:diguanylate cyclase (GGDEF)-like protein/putative nucleotidyltransferase with HDIG domain